MPTSSYTKTKADFAEDRKIRVELASHVYMRVFPFSYVRRKLEAKTTEVTNEKKTMVEEYIINIKQYQTSKTICQKLSSILRKHKQNNN